MELGTGEEGVSGGGGSETGSSKEKIGGSERKEVVSKEVEDDGRVEGE